MVAKCRILKPSRPDRPCVSQRKAAKWGILKASKPNDACQVAHSDRGDDRWSWLWMWDIWTTLLLASHADIVYRPCLDVKIPCLRINTRWYPFQFKLRSCRLPKAELVWTGWGNWNNKLALHNFYYSVSSALANSDRRNSARLNRSLPATISLISGRITISFTIIIHLILVIQLSDYYLPDFVHRKFSYKFNYYIMVPSLYSPTHTVQKWQLRKAVEGIEVRVRIFAYYEAPYLEGSTSENGLPYSDWNRTKRQWT